MSEFTARVSLAVTGHLRTDSDFDSLLVYPASFERLLTDGVSAYQCQKVYADAGVVVAGGKAVDLSSAGFVSVKLFLLQNLTDPTSGTGGTVSVAGGVSNPWTGRTASVARGQVDFATNDVDGWAVSGTAKNFVIGGTAGTAYKIILFGN
jgi:hypothetical protein